MEKELERRKEYYIKNRERIREYDKQYAKKNKDRRNLLRRERRKKDPINARKNWLKYKYGLTLEQYENMKLQQKEKCKLCDQKKFLVIDHNHLSGKIRGLLCQGCNKGLGHFQENIIILKEAIKYLSK